MNNHKYIKLLEYAVSKTDSYHMEPGLIEANMTESEFELIRDSLFINAHLQSPPPNKSQIFEWRLRPEAVFGYLSYKQYEHAQKSSKKAIYIATVSAWVAAATLVITIGGFAL